MRKKTGIVFGTVISIIGFILAVVSVVIETHIHKENRDNMVEDEQYRELMFRNSMISSFGEIGIFLGFLMMNFVVVIHLWDKF